MKTILYVGATLMIGASIYGFVDYKKTSHKKEFTGMYDDQPVVKKTTEPVKTEVVSVTVPEKPVVVSKQTSKKINQVKTSGKATEKTEVAPVIKPISDDVKLDVGETSLVDNSSVDTKIAEDKEPVKKVVKKKRIDSRLFSRAPIREEINISSDDKPAKKGKE